MLVILPSHEGLAFGIQPCIRSGPHSLSNGVSCGNSPFQCKDEVSKAHLQEGIYVLYVRSHVSKAVRGGDPTGVLALKQVIVKNLQVRSVDARRRIRF